MRVLLIEDSAADARLVRELTGEAGPPPIQLDHVPRLADALRRLAFDAFDAVLLDLGLPDCRGLEALTRVRAASPDVPVVIYSGHCDEQQALEAVRNGAQDYLLKDRADGMLLGRALRYAVERHRAELKIQHLAYHDGLTGLPNRTLFFDRLTQALARARRHERFAALLFIDVDDFKAINDTLGHLAGDQLLQQLAHRLSEQVRGTDTLGRLGGDEFALVLPDLARREDLAPVAAKVRAALDRPFTLGELDQRVTASIGVALYPDHGVTPEALLRSADAAMYAAKQNGACPSTRVGMQASERESDPRRLGGALRHALEAEQFLLHYQRRVDARTGECLGAEALLRWRHPTEGLLAPGSFLPLAEEMGLMEPIGRWVLGAACAEARRWNDRSGGRRLGVSVNLSGPEFANPALQSSVAASLRATGLAPDCLELELTEGSVMRDECTTQEALHSLRDLGVHLCIDDFGVGYSSLGRLRQVPIDVLKIDRSFVSGLPHDTQGTAIVTAIVDMAHSLGLRVVGEGVESAEQREHLAASRCDEMQGFLFGAPEPARLFEARLDAGGP